MHPPSDSVNNTINGGFCPPEAGHGGVIAEIA